MLRAYQTQTLPDELLLAAFEYLNPGHFFRTIPIISRHWNALSAALLGESAQLAAEVEIVVNSSDLLECDVWKLHTFTTFRRVTVNGGGRAMAVARLGIRGLKVELMETPELGAALSVYVSQLLARHFPGVAAFRRGVRVAITFLNMTGDTQRNGPSLASALNIVRMQRPLRVLASPADFSAWGVSKEAARITSVKRVDICDNADSVGPNFVKAMCQAKNVFPAVRHVVFHGNTRTLLPIPMNCSEVMLTSITCLSFPFTDSHTPPATFFALITSVLSALPNLRHLGEFHVFDPLWDSFTDLPGLATLRRLTLNCKVVQVNLVGTASFRNIGGRYTDDASAAARVLGWLFPYLRTVCVGLVDPGGRMDPDLSESNILMESWGTVVGLLPSDTIRFVIQRTYMPEPGQPWMSSGWRDCFLPEMKRVGKRAGKTVFCAIEGEDD